MKNQNREKPNVFLIIADSLRPDHLGCYGYSRDTSPNIDAFSRKAAVFENAFTCGPWTLPSHASLFTGLYPSEHQMVSGFNGIPQKLSAKVPTLAEILKDDGYQTIGLSSNPWVGESSGLNRGFDLYSEYNYDMSFKKDNLKPSWIWNLLKIASKTPKVKSFLMGKHNLLSKLYVRTLVDILQRNKSTVQDKPFFAFLNLMDPHNPYWPPANFLNKYSNESHSRCKYWNTRFGHYILGKINADDELKTHFQDFYDASISFMDMQIKYFLNSMSSLGLMENSIVIITADHGKTLGEHNRNEYPLHYMTDLNRRIPLIVYGSKGLEVGTNNQVCSLQDLFYFILEETGNDTRENRENKYRLSLTDRLNSDTFPFAITEVKIPYSGNNSSNVEDVACIDDGRYSFLSTSSQQDILWDRTNDPTQVKNYVNEVPEIAEKLSGELQLCLDYINASEKLTEESSSETNEEVIDRLKDLGYM